MMTNTIAPLTEEDRTIILSNAAMDTVVSMLVGDAIDAALFTRGEQKKADVLETHYLQDHVY